MSLRGGAAAIEDLRAGDPPAADGWGWLYRALDALAGLAIQRASIGRVDWAIEETVMNLAVNLYPMLHHRHTRTRIVVLLLRRARRTAGTPG